MNRLTCLSIILSMLFLGNTVSFAQSRNLDGSWEGKLMLNPEMGLTLVINITGSEGKNPGATMDSPDQGAYGIPMQVDYIGTDSLNVTVSQLMLNYKGKLIGDSISGEFSQGPLRLPLILKPKEESLNRPQTPLPPFPYITEEVTFQSPSDGASLYGTLSLPGSDISGTTAVLLVSGSGTQNRDEEIFGHKPFAVIADHLARNGIASLRYDDRGYDSSTGLKPNPTTYENTLDATGGVIFLKNKGFSKIGIIGHSEGGLIADKIAGTGNLIDFIVELAGPVVPGDSILIFQNEFLLRDGGLPDDYIALYTDGMRGLLQSHKEKDPVPFDETRHAIFSPENISNPVLAPLVKNLYDNFSEPAPWIRYFINYDPVKDIENISVPALMIFGENDTQVPPSLNVPALPIDNSEITVKVYPDLNHLMQHSESGKINEYGRIEETISPQVLEDITLFILSIE